MISSFYLSRFTADRLGGGKKWIDFVFWRQWPLAAILRPNKTLLSVLLKTRINRTAAISDDPARKEKGSRAE